MSVYEYGKTMKALIAVALTILASAAGAAEAGRYVAVDGDKTVGAMVARWAAQDGKVIRWDALYDVEIRNADGITQKAGLQSASTLDDAVQRVVSLLAEKSMSGEIHGRPMPLTQCVYSDGKVHMVIQTMDEPCRKSAD